MDQCAIPEPSEPKNLEVDLPVCHIRKVSSADLEDFVDWVESHRREWTDDELERYYNTIEHIADKLAKHRGHIWSWLQQVSKYLLEEQEARKLCRELIKSNLVTID